jgi:opacity protein-like surface antigen
MKKMAIAGFLGLYIAFVVFYSAPTFASDRVKFYFEGEVGASFVNLDSGGINIQGPHKNTGDDWNTTVVPGAHFGAELFRFLRADIGFNYRGSLNFKTNSYQPPVPTYFYKTDVDTYSLMFSLFFEPIHYKNWTPYIGAGVGSTWIKIETDDTVVEGSGRETKFAWQAEAGIQYELTKHFTLRLGYRYIDMGNFKTNLNIIGSAIPAGHFKGDLTGHDVVLGLRYRF